MQTPDISGEHYVVTVSTKIKNEGVNSQKIKILTEIIDSNGKVAATDILPLTSLANERSIVRQRLHIRKPKK